jgi:plastocyanin
MAMEGVRRMRTNETLVIGAVVLGLAGLSIAAAAEPPVTIRVFQFRPGQLEVKAGTKVTWINHDDITHTVTSGTPGTRDGRFDARLEGKGSAMSVEFTERGVYSYFCARHPSMRGEIRVN